MTPANDNRPSPQRPVGFDAALVAYLPTLRRGALMMTRDLERAEELMQETTINALARAASCRMETFRTWAFLTMRTTFLSMARDARRMKRTACEVPIDAFASADDVSPLEHRFTALRNAADQDEKADLSRLIDKLTQIRNGDIVLRRAMGEGLQDIADELGVSKQAVAQREERAREKLRAA